MHRAFGLSFSDSKWLILFVILLVIFVFAYHKLIQSSIQNHPESTYRAVREHCHYVLGKQFDQMAQDVFSDKFQSCDDFRIKSVTAAGGVFDPVMVKIILESPYNLPLDKDIFIFKTVVINFNFLSGLHGLISGNWEFNFYNTYSDFIFKGSV
ncbi:hypothetical protein [Methylobacter sp.]|uniref:hypothetical protein n=1 Tax=Methylobacter sp. TaxID=2051955 RepID=UPI0011FEB348|nr:hypothetical protein [Methylobacter sp.]TAK62726.1 MAG: hypothetical protein EPO18_09425 [Methylobacter sp.]